MLPARPAVDKDAHAAQFMDCVGNRAILDPLFKGVYPEAVLRRLGLFLPKGAERDLDSIRGRGTRVLRSEGGRFRIVHEHLSRMPHVP